jgi:anaerobic ribonucleoside-triphosphate reductase
MSKLKNIEDQISQIQAKLNDPKLCEGTADTYTRISGYYRPVSNFNDGKVSEVEQRLEYSI